MGWRPPTFAAEAEEEWQIIQADWWRIPFSSVSWAYTPEETKQAFAKPPYYHNSLFRMCSATNTSDDRSEEGGLNSNLAGVQGALDAVSVYETVVGFQYSRFPVIEPHELGCLSKLNFHPEIDEEELELDKEHWRELVDDLFSKPQSAHHRTSSLLSSDSEHSAGFFSMPSTPKAKSAEVHVLVKEVSPSSSVGSIDHHSIFSSPSRPLNATASSFVPSFSITPKASKRPATDDTTPTSFINFSFASLNDPPPPPMIKIKKDEQGFFTEVQVDTPSLTDRPSSALLPPFLQEPTHRRKGRASKTRQMVDRLRSQSDVSRNNALSGMMFDLGDSLPVKSMSHSPSPIFHDLSFIRPRSSVSEDPGRGRLSGLSTPSIDEDEDGWIEIAEPRAVSKSKRTRDLFLALTRRRTDSLSSENAKGSPTSENGSILLSDTLSTSPSPSPVSTPPSSCNDGWIEGPFTPPPVVRGKAPSSTISKSERQVHKRNSPSTTFPRNAHSGFAPPPLSSATAPSYNSLPPPHSAHHYPSRVQPYFYAYPGMPMPVPYTSFVPIQVPIPMGMQMPRPVVVPPAGSVLHLPPSTHLPMYMPHPLVPVRAPPPKIHTT
ncbi:hypothetical protein BDQ12DRAFT_673974 [Crucibulum laeve]|uniref:Uncharacterized protein n=1 Tax=Crucibulum laeve TaxID=68775 RepID=A0A5C3MK13_9AGAR|nr:hypothetical protein BDQ12DRAFT_673974 [Crucibulum laeve]